MKQFKPATILTILILFATFLQAQEKSAYSITARITGLADGTRALLFSFDKDKIVDSTFVRNHEFKFKGKLSHSPEIFWITFPDANNKTISILLGNENLSIKGDLHSPDKFTFTGSTYQPGWYKLSLIESAFQSKIDSLYDLEGESNNKLRRQVYNDRDQAMLRYIKTHLKNYEALIRLKDLQAYMPKDTLKVLYNKLPLAYQKSKYGKSIYSYLNALKVGDHFLDFSALTSDGTTKKFSEVTEKKYTMLIFGAAWCQPCKLSRPELKEIFNTYQNQLTIVYYSADVRKDMWLTSIKEDSLPYKSFWGGGKSTLPSKYGFTTFPGVALLDADGKIITLAAGYSTGKYLNLVKEYISE